MSDVAAWWGAVVATIVFAWDVIKWRLGGARLRVNVYPNMIEIGGAATLYPNHPSRRLVRVEVINEGDKKTTLTNLTGVVYKSKWDHLRQCKDAQHFVVNERSVVNQIPAGLNPGDRWDATFEQTDEFVKWARDGVLIMQIHHTMEKRPISKRLLIP